MWTATSWRFSARGTKTTSTVDAAVGAGYNDYDKINRGGLGGVTALGPIIGKTSGDTTGDEIDGMLGVGYDIKMDKFTLTPMASVYYTTADDDGTRRKRVPCSADDRRYRRRLAPVLFGADSGVTTRRSAMYR
jgi:hypothetical protein